MYIDLTWFQCLLIPEMRQEWCERELSQREEGEHVEVSIRRRWAGIGKPQASMCDPGRWIVGSINATVTARNEIRYNYGNARH